MTTIGMSPFSRLEVVRQGIPRPERREIIILRKGPKPQTSPHEPMLTVASVKEEPRDSATPVTLPSSGGRRKRTMASSSRRDGQQPPPLAVARRNARERNRVKQVNNGFANLRQHIPAAITAAYAAASGADLRSGGINGGGSGGGGARKLSKVETLRMAVDYIRRLQQLLAEADGVEMPTMGAASGARNSSGVESPPVLIEDDDDESITGLDTSSPEPQHSIEAGFPNTPEGASNSSLLNFVAATSPQRQSEQYFATLTSPSRQSFAVATTSPTRQQHMSETCIVPSALSVEELATSSSHFKQQDLSSRLPAVEQTARTILLSPEETVSLTQVKAEAHHAGMAYDVATLVSAGGGGGGGATSGLLRPQLPLPLSRTHLQQLSAYDASATSALSDDALDGGSATSTFLRAHQLAASLVAQGYHYTLQVPTAPHPVLVKKESGDTSDVMDVIGSWWDHEQKMRQQTAT